MKDLNFGIIMDLTKHFGSIVGTPGISQAVQDKANAQLIRLVNAFDETVDKALAGNAGLIV